MYTGLKYSQLDYLDKDMYIKNFVVPIQDLCASLSLDFTEVQEVPEEHHC